MSSEQARASKIAGDETENDKSKADDISSLFQMYKLAEVSGDTKTRDEFKPIMELVNQSSKYLRTAGELLNGKPVGDNAKKAQAKLWKLYPRTIEGVMALAEALADEDELEIYREVLNKSGAMAKLKANRFESSTFV